MHERSTTDLGFPSTTGPATPPSERGRSHGGPRTKGPSRLLARSSSALWAVLAVGLLVGFLPTPLASAPLLEPTAPHVLGSAPGAHSPAPALSALPPSPRAVSSGPNPILATVDLVNRTVLPGNVATGNCLYPASGVDDPVHSVFYLTCYSSNQMVVLNSSTGALVGEYAVGASPVAAALDTATGLLYVSDDGGNVVAVVNTTSSTLVGTIPVGTSPQGVAVDPFTGDALVANYGSNDATLVDGSTMSVLGVVHLGTQPQGVAFDSTHRDFYVANYGTANLTAVNATTLAIDGTLAVGTDPIGVADDPATHDLFVANFNSWNVSVVDAATFAPVRSISLGSAHPQAITYDPVSGDVFTAGYISNNVTVIDATTLTTLSSIPTAAGGWAIAASPSGHRVYEFFYGSSEALAISDVNPANSAPFLVGASPDVSAFDPQNGRVYVTDQSSDFVYVVNATTYAVMASVPVGAGTEGVAYDSSNGDLYATDSFYGNVTVIDGSTDRTIASVPTACALPTGIVYDPLNGDLYVACSGSVSVIDGATNTQVAMFNFGTSPRGLAVDTTTGLLYVANFIQNNVTALNTTTGLPVSWIPTGPRPWSLAYDARDARMFVSNLMSGNVSVIDTTSRTDTGHVNVGQRPEGLAYDPLTGNVYVTNTGSFNVSFFNATTLGQPGSVLLPSSSAYAVAVVYDGSTGTMVASDTGLGALAVIGAPALASASLAPTSSVLPTGGNQTFSATALCAGGPCGPGPISYTWAVSNGLAALNLSTGPQVKLSAGSVPGTVGLFVNITRAGRTFGAFAQVTVQPGLASVAVTPVSATTPVGGVVNLTATASCTGGTCPVGTTFNWTTPTTLGSLNVTTGPMVRFTAGMVGGQATLYVNGTLQGVKVMGAPVVLTILPTLASLTVSSPSTTPPVGGSSNLTATVACLGGPCPGGTTIDWTTSTTLGSLNATTGPMVRFTAGLQGGQATVYVNATLHGVTVKGTPVVLTILPTLASLSVTPSSATVQVGQSAVFSAAASCNGGACPATPTYTWTLGNGLGTLNATHGSSVTFTAGALGGREHVFLNASLNGIARSAPAASLVLLPSLSSVSVSPGSATIGTGASATFQATVACTGGPCPTGAVYAWSLSNNRGSLGSTTGPSVVLTAGGSAGTVELFVNVTLNGTVRGTSVAVTITGGSGSGPPTFLGLPPLEGYVLVGVIVLVVVMVVAMLSLRSRKSPPSGTKDAGKDEKGETPSEETSKGSALPSSEKASPSSEGSPPSA